MRLEIKLLFALCSLLKLSTANYHQEAGLVVVQEGNNLQVFYEDILVSFL